MSVRKKIRSTKFQIKYLIDYMASHPRLAEGEYTGPQGKRQKELQWLKLRTILNQFGPNKSIAQWEHTWRDLRRKARNQSAKANEALGVTSNNLPMPSIPVNSLNIMIETIKSESAFDGDGAEESGVGDPLSLHNVSDSADVDEMVRCRSNHCEPSPNPPPRPSATSFEADADELLEAKLEINDIMKVRCGSNHRELSPNPPPRPSAASFRAGADEFLEAKLEMNETMKGILNQLTIANRHNAIRTRIAFRERLWRLRRQNNL
ncbi:uncharacterized protein LOC113227843 [Hyposmocoma kahamanoa]|uniref:uncharacterized protein LOC113227843 n=1 Tax=Hyposmocoma kahamanoa TaxID=1477025 RepID=UPI000E6D8B34|nr:uncharacterized protein LOC113227843 [Hyposmocoma kahamanoa]